ncbi:MAG: hypothetical protein V1728_04510 [Candidatus Micrarchaeota archaeon]
MKAQVILAMLGLMGMVLAQMDDFSAARQLVSQNVSCANLNDSQLELIGDYYMEQMHPGAAHAYMDSVMGGEGSASLRNTHIQIAEAFYCGRTDTPVTYAGMMGVMPMMGRYAYGSAADYGNAPA